MRRYVEGNLLAGVSTAVLIGREVVDQHLEGWADRENKIALREDHLFRVMSNTKLVTSCAVLLLLEDGRLALDDPIERFITQLGKRRVLLPGATSLTQTEPARSSITIRHLLSHSAGLSYGVLDPTSLLASAYVERAALDHTTPLTTMIDILEGLPLAYHPGQGWEYSIATDVLGRLVEVVSGKPLDVFMRERIFEPLAMRDTSFVIPQTAQDRLVAHYVGADLLNPMTPGLTRDDNLPYPGAYRSSVPRLSGGGGLISSLPDMITLIRSLLPDGPTLLRPDTLAMMKQNQLPDGQFIRFARMGPVKGKGYGLAGAVTLTPSSIDAPQSVDEFQWGGVYGTHWWYSPRHKLSGITMAQRQFGFWHPYSFEFKRLVYRTVLGQ